MSHLGIVASSPSGDQRSLTVDFSYSEKQKARYTYGILERQFRKVFAEAERLPGVTGENLLVLLERRLDNVVYRLGFASSRSQARQLVRHGHFQLNARKTDIPSCLVKPGDVIAWREASTQSEYYKTLVQEIETGLFLVGWRWISKNWSVESLICQPVAILKSSLMQKLLLNIILGEVVSWLD